MLAFGTLFFFSFTGLTLNHTDWFFAEESRTSEYAGQLEAGLLGNRDVDPLESEDGQLDFSNQVDKLGVAEQLRKTHSLDGMVTNFSIDEFQYVIVFAGPGYVADVFVDRETGKYHITESVFGSFAVLNDLHKGRDSGLVWKTVIDISAVLCMLLSMTGIWLMCYIRGRWLSGLITGLCGCILLWAIYFLFVP